MTFRLTDRLNIEIKSLFGICNELKRPLKLNRLEKTVSGRISNVSQFQSLWTQWAKLRMTWMDRYCACSFEHRHISRKTTHSKCRSAIIPNKRSLNFILVFSYKFLFLSFSLGLFWPLKKNISQHIFRLLFSSWHRCGQSAIRIDICGFRRNIKDNKKNCIHIVKHVVKTHFDTQRRHRYNPLECERKRFFFLFVYGATKSPAWHVTFYNIVSLLLLRSGQKWFFTHFFVAVEIGDLAFEVDVKGGWASCDLMDFDNWQVVGKTLLWRSDLSTFHESLDLTSRKPSLLCNYTAHISSVSFPSRRAEPSHEANHFLISPRTYICLLFLYFKTRYAERGAGNNNNRKGIIKCPSIERWSRRRRGKKREKNYKIIEHIKFRNRIFSSSLSASIFFPLPPSTLRLLRVCAFLMESPFLLSMNQICFFFLRVFSIPLAF